MSETSDIELLQQYARDGSEAAFAALVARHVNLVYSAALRKAGTAHAAEEITQVVFIILAKKARALRPGTVLAGWLYQTTRLTAINFLRGEIRRARREQEAIMQSLSHESEPEDWSGILPLLEDAMGYLSEKDRNAVILRFFEGKPFQEIGATLGSSENAAKKRVAHALEKLRRYFHKRGVASTVAAIAAALSAHSIQAAPSAVATAAAAAGIAQGAAATTTTLLLMRSTLGWMVWMKYKGAIGAGAIALIVAGTLVTVLLRESPREPRVVPDSDVKPEIAGGETLTTQPPAIAVREPLTEAAFIGLSSPPGGLVVQPDGKIIVASSLFGFFVDPESGTLGYFRRGAVRLNPDGSLDRSFRCNAEFPGSDAHRAHLELSPDGRIFMSGLFDSLDGKLRAGYAMLSPDGRVDESFEPRLGTTNIPERTYLPGGVRPATLLSNGSVAVLSGAIEGPRAPYPLTVYRLNPSGRMRPSTYTNSPSDEFSRPSGLVLTLGPVGFWARKPVDWHRDTPAARRPPFQQGTPASDLPAGAPVADLPFERWTEPPSAVDAAVVFETLFDEVPLELCRYAVRLPDGGAILAVRDEAVDGSLKARGRFMRFDKDWRPDFSFTNQFEADLRSCITLKRQDDGKLFVAGLVGTIDGEEFPGLVRLEQDGAIDRSFRCQITNDISERVMAITIQKDGRIVIGGFFTAVNGVPCQHLARLNPDGSLDGTFKNPFLGLAELNTHRRFPVHRLAEAAEGSATNAAISTATAPSAEMILITSLNYQAGVAVIQFSGSSSAVYVLQAKDSLEAGDWSSIGTTQVSAAGTGIFRDENARNHPSRFYRIAKP